MGRANPKIYWKIIAGKCLNVSIILIILRQAGEYAFEKGNTCVCAK